MPSATVVQDVCADDQAERDADRDADGDQCDAGEHSDTASLRRVKPNAANTARFVRFRRASLRGRG